MRCKIHWSLIIISTIILHSCTEISNQQRTLLVEQPKEKITIDLDSLTPNYTIPQGCKFINLDGRGTLVYYNRLTYTLNFFDIKTCHLIHKIQYTKQGMYPVNHLNGIEIINKDSIFLLPMYIKRLYLSDWHGKIQHVYNLQSNPNMDKIWKNEPAGQIDIIDRKCIMATTPLGNQNIPQQYFKIPLGAILDLQTEKMFVNFIAYPEIYQKGEKWGFYHAQGSQCVDDKGNIVVSFGIDPNLYLYNKQQRLIKTSLGLCEAFSERIDSFRDIGEEEKYCYNQNQYEQVIFDKYNQVYYRFATKGVDGKEPISSKMLYKGLFKPLYVLIFDKNLNKIGEVELPKNKHYFLNKFVAPEGLYISDSHPENTEKNENKLNFTCYKLVYNQ